ncbi:MAG TPA: sulfurtransferase, partial [Anaerolineaceae bacterium]|nr:sulfurtransferase [Anaerolineaceae bacterium]
MATYTTLIEVEDLFANFNHPDWVVVDCRFDLKNPDWGFKDYQEGHIPGSVYAHLDHDLSAAPTPSTGRHP